MIRKQVEIFEQDYEKLLLLAGSPEKIAHVISSMMHLIDGISESFLNIYGQEIMLGQPRRKAKEK